MQQSIHRVSHFADQSTSLLKDVDFCSTMDNEEAQAQLQKKKPSLNHPQKSVDSPMKSPKLQRQSQQSGQNLVDQIGTSNVRQRSSNLLCLPSGVFWTLINNKCISEHIREQAAHVVEMINEKPCLEKKEQATAVHTVSSEVNLLSSNSETSSTKSIETEFMACAESPEFEKTVQPTAPSFEADKIDVAQMCEKVKASVQRGSPPKQNPEQILHLLASDHWRDKFNALTAVQALIRQNPESLKEIPHKLVFSISNEVKNLRSVVSGLAINTLSVMFTHLKKSMDDTITETGGTLLQKASDSSAFIRRQADEALASMVENCNPLRVLNLLVKAGLNHGNAAVRTSAALNISRLLNFVGPKRFSQLRDFSKVFVVALSVILQDRSADVRRRGSVIYQELCGHGDFQRAIPEKDWSAVEELVSNLRRAPKSLLKPSSR